MEKMTLIVKLSPEVKAWLTSEGDAVYRSAQKQAEFLCAQYLIRAAKAAMPSSRNGSRTTAVEEDGMVVVSNA